MLFKTPPPPSPSPQKKRGCLKRCKRVANVMLGAAVLTSNIFYCVHEVYTLSTQLIISSVYLIKNSRTNHYVFFVLFFSIFVLFWGWWWWVGGWVGGGGFIFVYINDYVKTHMYTLDGVFSGLRVFLLSSTSSFWSSGDHVWLTGR